MDTGPQKESDATGSSKTKKKERERGRKRERAKGKRHFKARPERQVGNDSKTGRKKTANTSNNFVVVECFKLKLRVAER